MMTSFILYDDFKTDTLNEVRKVYNFLGVDDSFVPEIKQINANKEIRGRAFQKFQFQAMNYFLPKFCPKNSLNLLKDYFRNHGGKQIKTNSYNENT